MIAGNFDRGTSTRRPGDFKINTHTLVTQGIGEQFELARLARDGLTNSLIGARLFISPRTVEYHLHKVFPKLNISSGKELRHALPGLPSRVTGEHD